MRSARTCAEPRPVGADRNDDASPADPRRQQLPVFRGIHEDDVGHGERRPIESREAGELQRIVFASIARGVAGADQMVQHERSTREEQPREMHIEVAHVPDDDRIGRRQTSPSAYELDPAPRQLERERGQPASALQHCYARGGVEFQRYVALDDFMPVLSEALAQDPDARGGRRCHTCQK